MNSLVCTVLLSSFLLIAGCGDSASRLQDEISVAEKPSSVERGSPEPTKATLVDLPITNGMPESAVLEILGEPNGMMKSPNSTMLLYPGGNIELANGRVVNLDPNFAAKWMEGIKTAAQEAEFKKKQEAKGLVLYDGIWMKPADKERLVVRKQKDAQEQRRKREILNKLEKRYSSVVYRDKKGNPIDHSKLLTRGKITIVDFYADWCGPCRDIAPKLAAYARSEKSVVLKKVDIGKWGSVPARKYNVNSVPSLRVFDRKGRLVGQPTSSLRTAQRYVETAKRRP